MRKNNAKFWSVLSIIIAVAGTGLFIAGIWIDEMDSMWMIMTGLLLAITFYICFGIFIRQANRLSGMFRGKDLLAHWVYSNAEQQEQIKDEKEMRTKGNKMILLIVSGFFVFFTVLFLIFGFDDMDDALPFIIIMMAVLALIWAVALLAPVFAESKMKKSAKEAYIGMKGAWVMGEYAVWDAPFVRLTDIQLINDEIPAIIAVTFQMLQRYGWQTHTFRIPVPSGREEEALRVLVSIQQSHGL